MTNDIDSAKALTPYLDGESPLLDKIRAAARQAASANSMPQVQVSATEKYGVFGHKVRSISRDAGYWILITVIEYGLQEPVARDRGNGNITELEREIKRSYCLATDGTLFSFTHETEAGCLDKSQWMIFVDKVGDREPFESNMDVFLADFDFSIFVDRETPYFRERFMSVCGAASAARGSLAAEYNWMSVVKKFDVKGQGLLEHLQAIS